MSKEALLAALQPILKSLDGVDVGDPAAARAWLEQRWPVSSLQSLKQLVRGRNLQH